MLHKNLSTNGLKQMHGAVTRAMADDDARHPNDRQYGVRHYPDWRDQADQIEAELAVRHAAFIPLRW